MKYRFIHRPAVGYDIEDAFDYYHRISPRLARQFLKRIREAQNHISKYPESFEVKYKEVRTVLLKQFPYHIHYLVDEKRKLIIILAVVHAYRKPKDYSNR